MAGLISNSAEATRLAAERAEIEADYRHRIQKMGLRRLMALCAMFLLLLVGAIGMRQVFVLYGSNGIAPEDQETVYLLFMLVLGDAVLVAIAGLVRTYYNYRIASLRQELAQFQTFP